MLAKLCELGEVLLFHFCPICDQLKMKETWTSLFDCIFSLWNTLINKRINKVKTYISWRHFWHSVMTFNQEFDFFTETNTKVTCSQLWWLYICTFCIQEAEVGDCHKFKVCLGHIMSSRSAWASEWGLAQTKSRIVGKGACCQAWQPKFEPWVSNSGKRTVFKLSSDLHICPVAHVCTHTRSQNAIRKKT